MRTRNADKQELVKRKSIEMVVKDGLEGFSVNKLAKACGISVATLYIYYKDKDDLIAEVAKEEAERMSATVLKGFDPEAPFAEGLRLQWKNRAKHMMENPLTVMFFEQLRHSSYQETVWSCILMKFKDSMGRFLANAIDSNEIEKMPVEVFWSIAFSPLYSLLRFHHEGSSFSGKPFVISQKIIWQTFGLVLKALKK